MVKLIWRVEIDDIWNIDGKLIMRTCSEHYQRVPISAVYSRIDFEAFERIDYNDIKFFFE